MAEENNTRATYVLLFLILAAGLAVRVLFIRHDYPYVFNPDEHFYAHEGINLAGGIFPSTYERPSFYLYFLAAADAVFFAAGRLTGAFESLRDFQLTYISHTTDFVLLARLVSASFSWLTIGIVFLAGRRLFGKAEGLASAAIVAVSPVHIKYAQEGITDSTKTFWSAAVLLPAISIVRTGSATAYGLAGLFVGFAAAAKYPAVFCAVTVAAAHFARRDRKGVLRWLVRREVALSALCACGGFLAGCPFVLLDGARFFSDIAKRLDTIQRPWLGLNPYSTGFELYFREVFLGGEGIVFTLVLLAGCVFLLARRPRRGFVLLVFPVLYFCFVGRKRFAADRYIQHIMPHLQIVVGASLVAFARFVTREKNKTAANGAPATAPGCFPAAAVLLVALTIAQPICRDIAECRLKTLVDVRFTAMKWIEKNIPAGSKLLVDYTTYGPPVARRKMEEGDERGVWDQVMFFARKRGMGPEDALVKKHLAVLRGRPVYSVRMITLPPSPGPDDQPGPEIPLEGRDYAIMTRKRRLMVLDAPDYPVLMPFKRFYERIRREAVETTILEQPRAREIRTIEIYKLRK